VPWVSITSLSEGAASSQSESSSPWWSTSHLQGMEGTENWHCAPGPTREVIQSRESGYDLLRVGGAELRQVDERGGLHGPASLAGVCEG
jgi:hypothetical protein